MQKRVGDGLLQKVKILNEEIGNKDLFIRKFIVGKRIVDKNEVDQFFDAFKE